MCVTIIRLLTKNNKGFSILEHFFGPLYHAFTNPSKIHPLIKSQSFESINTQGGNNNLYNSIYPLNLYSSILTICKKIVFVYL